MSYANGTQFYNLPQTVGTDKRDWFDENQAFADVDAALHAAVTGQAADAEAISTINAKLLDDEADIAALQTTSGTHTTQITTLQTTVNTQASQIADVRQDSEDMICAYNEGAAETSTHAYEIGDYFIYNDVLYKATAAIAIGDTIVPNTNCSATNATTEIAQLNSDLTDLVSSGTTSLVAGTGVTLGNTNIRYIEIKGVKIVTLHGAFSWTAGTVTAGYVIATIPEGLRPLNTLVINCVANDLTVHPVYINSAGEIAMQGGGIGSLTAISFEMPYIIN